jgi:uncharacterized protein with von Willebrand factor type A (vWA) domain
MLFWIVQQSIFSFVFIWIIHYLYSYFTNNLTVPKIKDLVNKPKQQYDTMYKVIEGKNNDKKEKTEKMKDNLKSYLSSLKKGTSVNSTMDSVHTSNLQYVPY